MTTAAYFRVSSKGQDLALQRDALSRKGVVPALEYSEKMSARTTDRPELKRLLADARAGLFTHLWVFKLDRLTRSGVADTFAVVSELRRAGVTLSTVADGLTIKPGADITSDALVFAFSIAAQLEHAAIRDRIAAARVAKEAKGEAWGRPLRMTPAQVERARELHAEGHTVREVSSLLNVPRATVGRALRTGT